MAEDAPMAENGASGELENGAENEELKKVAGDLSELALKIWTSMEETKALDASDNGLDDDMARGPAGAPAPDVKSANEEANSVPSNSEGPRPLRRTLSPV